MKNKNKKTGISPKYNRLIFVLGFLCLFSTGFPAGLDTYAQTKKITLKLTDKTISEIFQDIEKNSEYVFLYSENVLDDSQEKTIHIDNKSISEVLEQLFAGMPIGYTINNRQISLKQTSMPAQQTFSSSEENKKLVTGVVSDANGEALIGATILIKGSTIGVITNLDGDFSLNVTPSDELIISYIGYVTKHVKVGTTTNFDIVLTEDISELDAVVVTALGIKRSEKALSYNVQSVGSEDIVRVKDANFMNALSGKIAGVTINASSAGTGGATRVVMRGVKSISANNNALYVIDGVPIFNVNNGETEGEYAAQPGGEGISDINPEDIESMTILSGPAAAALYGSNAAQGVILITTKKGKVGKVSVSISNTSTFSSPFLMPEFQNTYANTPGEYRSWGEKLDSPSSFDPKDFFNTGVNIQNNVSLSLGSEKSQYYLSVGTTNASGIITNSNYNRSNFNFRSSTNFLNDKLTLDAGVSYILQNDQNLMAQGEYFNPLLDVYLFPRGEDFDEVRMYERWDEGRQINTQYWPYADRQNPYWIANRMVRTNNKNRYMLNASLKYEIADWINISGRVRVDNSTTDSEQKRHASTEGLFAGPKGFYRFTKTNDNQTYGDVLLDINKVIGDFSFAANVGGSVSYMSSNGVGLQGALKDIPNLFTYFNIDLNGGRDSYPIQSGWEEVTLSMFASAEIGWRSRLYLTVTGRNDWASALVNTEQSSFAYPSVGLSAIISEMITLPEAISYLKVHGSWASVGSPIPRGLSQPRYVWDESTGKWTTNTFRPIGKLFPERTDSWEGGLSAKFFQNRITLDGTVYKSNTKNQTFNIPVSASSGYASMYVQSGNVENWGIEATLGLNNTFGEFRWNSTLTYSMNRNKVVELLDDYYDEATNESYSLDEFGAGGIGSLSYKLTKGGSMGDFYVNKRLKRDAEGNIFINKDTQNVELENLGKPQKAGSVLPKANLGFKNDFNYKFINLGFLITARFGGDVISITQATMDQYGVSETTAIARENGGIAINNGTISAENYYQLTGGKNGLLHNYVYSATNVRLQEVYVGVDLPKKWFNDKLNISCSLIGRNLLMLYCKAPFDPESTGSTGTFYQGVDMFMQPSLTNYGFNVKIQF